MQEQSCASKLSLCFCMLCRVPASAGTMVFLKFSKNEVKFLNFFFSALVLGAGSRVGLRRRSHTVPFRWGAGSNPSAVKFLARLSHD